MEPILKLFIDIINIENFEILDIRCDLIESSIINIINIPRNIVLSDLSNKKDRKLLVI